MHYIGWLLGLIVTIVIVVFSLANRAKVGFDLWPLPFTVEMPLYFGVMGSLAAGLILGWIVSWFGRAPLRRRIRERDRMLAEKDRRIAELETRLPPPEPEAPPVTVAAEPEPEKLPAAS